MSHYKPDANKSVNLTIDGIPVTVPEGTTILEAARKAQVEILTLCDRPDLRKRAVCRLCVVEADGRGKLIAACANDVWEGASIVTNNARLIAVRKTIIELLLANHPQECLGCVRNTACELQSLAERFGVRSSPFRREAAARRPKEIAGGVLVRDMDKCVKCGRCVEVCQEVQTVRAIDTSRRSVNYEICAPYGTALADGPCVFCGQCAEVCPVGAIYEHDQTDEVWAAVNAAAIGSGGQKAAAALDSSAVELTAREFGLSPESVTSGKMVTALKRTGFDKVFDSGFFAEASAGDEAEELSARIKGGGKLPMIRGCSPGVNKFVREFYPELTENLFTGKSAAQVFEARVKKDFAPSRGIDAAQTAVLSVSIVPCAAGKFEAGAVSAHGVRNPDLVLTTRELARMIRLAGIELSGLEETPFDTAAAVRNGGEAERRAGNAGEVHGAKTIVVNGLGNARAVLDAAARGECDAALVRIMSCPEGCAMSEYRERAKP